MTTRLAICMNLFFPSIETIFLFQRTCHKKNQLAYEQFACLETKINLLLMSGDWEGFVTYGTSKFCWTEVKFGGKGYKETTGSVRICCNLFYSVLLTQLI